MDIQKYFSRRRFLQILSAASSFAALGSAAGLTDTDGAKTKDWNQGDLSHLIPIVSHDRILIKASFKSPLPQLPFLSIDGKRIAGQMTDSAGQFWQFYAVDLEPNRQYQLQITDKKSRELTDTWPLKTFPTPEAQPDHVRILAFTCAGGNEDLAQEDGSPFFLEIAARQQLMNRGLAFNPDVVISNGDHIYWDQETMVYRPPGFQKPWRKLYEEFGTLKPELLVIGSSNEAILKRIADPQIANLYGLRFRSVPVFMLTDDHDLFENDDAHEGYISLPPESDKLAAARATQQLYYPEFLPDNTRSENLDGSSSKDRGLGLSEVYGTLRYGNLFEALLYDTKRYCTLDGENARLFSSATENWLKSRTEKKDTAHLMHIPSTPIGWSAGKWGNGIRMCGRRTARWARKVSSHIGRRVGGISISASSKC